ncbi:MAG: DUF2281 domain-containing protein [Bacteroidota bacterium]
MNQHILTQINNMPESVKTELLAYAEFLISKYKKDKKKHPVFGSAKNKYSLTSDFNEQLKDFEDYQ